jgi:riboflavin biosynthesis pyrimidine reductase
MQRLWPDPAEIDDVAALIAAEARPAPADRPWLLVNMVSSLDGAIAIGGRSGGLGGPADKAVFSALRGIADVILVGAGTARAEGYGPPRPTDATRAARVARGQASAPRLALVTRSLDLDLATPMFTEADERPYVITSGGADPVRRAAVGEVAELVVTGDAEVDLPAALAALGAAGAGVITAEGGPRLNGDLLDHGLVDEWDLTLSPLLVGGDAARAIVGAPPVAHAFRLARLLEGDGLLLGRWIRER